MTTDLFATPDSPKYFDTAAAQFSISLTRLHDLSSTKDARTGELTMARADRADRESYITANGGTDLITIDGKNAEGRKAQLELACNRDEQWIEANAKVNLLLSVIATLDTDENESSNLLSLAKRRMDYAITFLGHDTALKNIGAMQNAVDIRKPYTITYATDKTTGLAANNAGEVTPVGLYGNKAH
jgi:hypothetical protein